MDLGGRADRAAAPPKDSGAYAPKLAARLDDDPNLTDGARRCARKLAEYTYRRARTAPAKSPSPGSRRRSASAAAPCRVICACSNAKAISAST
jgi:hypothetical protein